MSKLAVSVVAYICLEMLLLFVNLANGECCRSVTPYCKYCPKRCADDTKPAFCCAYGSCNMFCCNCDGGCRGMFVITKRDVTSSSSSSSFIHDTAFQQIDLDGDKFVNKTEARTHLLSGECGNHTDKIGTFDQIFNNFDKDGDGKLSYHEINTAG